MEQRNALERVRRNTDVEVPTPLARARETMLESYYLLVLSGSDIGRRCPLSDGLTAIGRAEDCEIQLTDSSVSRRHMESERAGDDVWVRDLSSTNGTVINGREVSRRIIREGDVLRVGEISLRFNRGSLHKTTELDVLYSSCAHDPLTGTFTNHHYDVVKEREAARSRRYFTPLCEVDIQLQLTSSSLTQEECMWTIGRLLSRTCRHEDVIGKTGTGQFSLLLPHTGPEAGKAALNRIEQMLKERLPDEMTQLALSLNLRDLAEQSAEAAS